MRRRLLTALIIAVCATGAAVSQPSSTDVRKAAQTNIAPPQTEPLRLRGTIQHVDDAMLTIVTDSGQTETIRLRPDLRVNAIASATLGDIKPGRYIGSAAVKQPDGVFRALEVHLFPVNMRGHEFVSAYDLQPDASMVNATVGTVTGTGDRTLDVRVNGKPVSLYVPASAPIVQFEPGTLALVKPGAHAVINARHGADGVLFADRVNVGKDGLVPPM